MTAVYLLLPHEVLFDTAGYALLRGLPGSSTSPSTGQRFLMLKRVAATDGGGSDDDVIDKWLAGDLGDDESGD